MQPQATLDTHNLQMDHKGMIAIYDRLSPRLFRYAVRLLGDADLAEECVAETFSRFLHALKSGGGPREHVQAYLYRIAHNWITDHYRRPVAEEPLENHLHLPSSETPAALATKNLERERVRQALLQLTDEQQQVILLRFYEDWPHEETAAVIGKTPEASRALQHRALAVLRKILIGPLE